MALDESWVDGLLQGPTGPTGPAGPTGPSGGGMTIPAGDIGGTLTTPLVIGLQGIALSSPGSPSLPVVWVFNPSTGKFDLRQLTSDDLGTALVVTLSGGSGGVFEPGDTWTLTGLTGSPAGNASGVTVAQLAEIINGVTGTVVNDLGQGNPLTGAQLPHTSYTRSGSGDVVDLQWTIDKNGVTKASALGSVRGTWPDPWYEFSDTVNAPTGMTLATNTAQLTGGGASAVGTKYKAVFPIGTTFTCPVTGSPYYKLLAVPTGSLMTFADTNNSNFPLSRIVTNTSYSNQFSVAHGFDIYVSNLLNPVSTITVHRAT